MIIPSVGTVSASINDIMFDLTSLGVLEEADKNLPLEENMTRAEFANLVVNAMGYGEMAQTLVNRGYFSDLGASPYVGEINLLYELNILSGTGEGTFGPDSLVTYPQVGKIMVNVLGYSNIVNNKDLSSYYYQASILGVYNDVDTTKQYVTREAAYIMIRNCLEIDIMTVAFNMFGSGSYAVQEGNTLKSFLQTAEHHNLIKLRGVVTGDSTTYIYEEFSKNKSNLIEIDGTVYKCSFEVPRGLVGMAVDFYVEYTDDSSGVIASISPSDKNMVVDFNLLDLAGVTADEVKYMVDDNIKDFKYNVSTKLIYNGRRDLNGKPSDILNYKNGTVKAIDNNEDEIFDIIYVYEYKDAIVERLYTETKQVYFANNRVVNGAKYVSLDDEELLVTIADTNGTPVAFEEIPEDSVISFAKSKDNKVITAVISDKKVTGKVNIIEDDYATIGTDVLRFNSEVNLTLGKNVTAYVNFMDMIVFADETVTYDNYAYVLKVSGASGLKEAKVALVAPGYISEKSEESFSDEGGTSSTTKKLYFRNSAKYVYPMAENVTINGKRTVKDDKGNTVKYTLSKVASMVTNQVVSYTVNAEGKISNFDIIEPYDKDTYKKYYQSGKVFSNGSGDGFGITDANTMSICVPKDIAGSTDDDLLVPVMLLNSTEYAIKAYDVDENTHIAGLVVVTEEMKAGLAGNITADSDVAVIKRISRRIVNGEERLVVNMYTKDGEKNYTVSPLISNVNQFLAAGMGDLVAYTLVEGNDELNAMAIIQDANNYNGNHLTNANTDNELCLGTVVDARYDFVSQTKGRWTDEVTINYGSSTIKYEIYNTGTPPIFLLEDQDIIKRISFDDIQIGDKIFVSVNYGAIRAVMIRR